MVGLQLLDSRAIAVALDDGGRLVKRVSVNAAPDLGAAAIAAVDQVRPGPSDSVGIASATPDAAPIAAAAAAVGKRFPGVSSIASTSGVAAAVAESWLGVGRGFKDVVFFSVAEHATGGIVRDGSPIDGGHRRAASVACPALT